MIDFSNEKANASSICLNQYSPHPHGMLEVSIYECSCYHAAKVWPGQGQAAQQLQWPVDHNTTHSVCSRATVGRRAPVSSLCTLHIEEEWRSENCVMVTCMKKICSLKVFSKVPFMILSLYNKKLIHHMITVKEIMILDV